MMREQRSFVSIPSLEESKGLIRLDSDLLLNGLDEPGQLKTQSDLLQLDDYSMNIGSDKLMELLDGSPEPRLSHFRSNKRSALFKPIEEESI